MTKDKLFECTTYYGADHPTAPGALYARTGETLVVRGPLFDKGGMYTTYAWILKGSGVRKL